MTITDPKAVAEIMNAGGYTEDGWNIPLIYSYTSLSGERCFALFTSPDYDDMSQSPYIHGAVRLMVNGILTEAGKEFLQSLQE